jgi:preprotein translocase subunit SecD
MDSYRLRSWLALAGVLLALFWAMPNFVDLEKFPNFPFKQKMNYGLDIQGGLHLVLGVDVEGVVTESTNRLVASLKQEFSKDGIQVSEVVASNPAQGEIQITAANSGEKEKVLKHLKDHWGSTLQELSNSDTSVTARYYDAYMTDYKEKVIQQAIETIRNRIDEFGVAEPQITKQGTDRILVQLPGMADAERAKELINTTAKLDFMIVDESIPQDKLAAMVADAEKAGNYHMAGMKYSEYVTKLNNDLKGKLPPNSAVYFEKAPNAKTMEAGAIPYLVKTDTHLGGADLDGAQVGYTQYGSPEVALSFNSSGAAKFADLTGANVGKRMAIVLDRIIKSAPNLKERIGGGRASITLGRGDNQTQFAEAQMISTALRAGALPASLTQLEERRVGPSLGADSITKAKFASYIGALLVVIFMIMYYKAMGVVSSVSLGINILSLFALLTSLGATLTLPGIAGIALTVGFAVDANVLINERIKEEMSKGGSFRAAIQEGYHRAMSAIIDANVTVAATAFVLLYFGTGPVRGFAVTLLVGIVTTMFANVFVSKVLVDTLINKFKVQKLSV